MNVFELAAKIAVDSSELKKGLNASETSISAFANKATKTLETLKKVFIGVVSVAAVKKIASGVFSLANATSQLGDRIDKQSQALGMSRKGFQEWDYILAQNGASIDSMGFSMRTLNQAILSGSKESTDALKELGLSVESLSGMSQEQAFEETVKALQQLPPGAQKSAVAMKLLGRNAQSLMPLLNSSTESVDELRAQAEKLGLVMSDDAIDASVAFGDALDDVKRALTATKNTLGAQVLPAFTWGLKVIANYTGRFTGYLRNAIETGDWKGLFDNVISDVKDAASRLWVRVTDTVPEIWENAQEALLSSDSVVLQTIGALMSVIADAVKYIVDNKEDFSAVINDVVSTVGNIVTTGIETVRDVFKWLNENGVETREIVIGIIGAFAVKKLANAAISFASILKSLQALSVLEIPAVINSLAALTGVSVVVASAIASVKEFMRELNEQHSIFGKDVDWLFPEDKRIKKDSKSVWDTVKENAESWFNQNGKNWTAYTGWIDDNIVSPFKEKWDEVGSWYSETFIPGISDAWSGIKPGVNAAVESVKTAFSGIVGWFKTNVVDKISGLFSGIFSSASTPGAVQIIVDMNGNEIPNGSSFLTNMTPEQLGQYGLSFAPKASGLSFVPENDYLASLHFGEAVLSRNEAEKWRKGQTENSGVIDLSVLTGSIIDAIRVGMESANINLDGEVVTRNTNRRMANDLKARRFAVT